jgi:hypothetical protein
MLVYCLVLDSLLELSASLLGNLQVISVTFHIFGHLVDFLFVEALLLYEILFEFVEFLLVNAVEVLGFLCFREGAAEVLVCLLGYTTLLL